MQSHFIEAPGYIRKVMNFILLRHGADNGTAETIHINHCSILSDTLLPSPITINVMSLKPAWNYNVQWT